MSLQSVMTQRRWSVRWVWETLTERFEVCVKWMSYAMPLHKTLPITEESKTRMRVWDMHECHYHFVSFMFSTSKSTCISKFKQ
jgi:hypothetical protein